MYFHEDHYNVCKGEKYSSGEQCGFGNKFHNDKVEITLLGHYERSNKLKWLKRAFQLSF
jgi:hypothetical protein